MQDQEAIDRVLAGDANAFAFLIERHKVMVFTLAVRMMKNREEAEEAAQDTFLKAFKSLNTFRKEARFSTWLYRIAYNNILSRIRLKKPPVDSIDDDGFNYPEPSQAADALGRLSDGERKFYISKAMEKLEVQEAAIVTLYYLQDADIGEISRIIKISHANVKIKLYRSRKKLYQYLEAMLKDELITLSGDGG